MTKARSFRPMVRKHPGALAALGLLFVSSVTGCSMLNSNIKGGFACSAPDGSCAPTTIIDDGALRAIKQSEKAEGAAIGDVVLPNGTPGAAPAQPATVILAADRLGKGARLASAIKARALRVVYPAHLDAAGRMVPKTMAYALVDLPEWAERQTGSVTMGDGRVATDISRGLLGAAEHAPDALAVLPASARVSVADPQLADAAPAAVPTAPPAQPATAAASPIDKIKAEATQILSAGKVKTAGTFASTGINP